MSMIFPISSFNIYYMLKNMELKENNETGRWEEKMYTKRAF